MIWIHQCGCLGLLGAETLMGRSLEAGAIAVGVFLIVLVAASLLRFETLVGSAPAKRTPEEAAFVLRIIKRLGTGFREPDPFLVIVIRGAKSRPDSDNDPDETLARTLRDAVRRSDLIARHGPDLLGLLVEAGRSHAESLAGRLLDPAGRETAPGTAPFAIGIASYPENGHSVRELIRAAEAALSEAAHTGGFALAPPAASDKDPADRNPAPERAEGDPPKALPEFLDPLTGAVRRERIESAIQKFLATYRRRQEPAAFLYFDVDLLSYYNERYGREAGDAVLREVGALLQRAVREEDLIGRYDDDSFLVAVVCSGKAALGVAQRLAAQIRRLSVVHEGHDLHLSATFGVAAYPEHGAHPRDLFEAAERALAAAKRKGRGTALLYDPNRMRPKEQAPPERDSLY